METNREVTISTKVDKRIADQLKRIAKQKEYRFSSYVKRVLEQSVQNDNVIKKIKLEEPSEGE